MDARLVVSLTHHVGNPTPKDMPTLTLSALESHLWEAANILRGSPVDRTDWKRYILPLMFFKRN
jgi:type I restriction enzyme M protein